MASEFIGVEHGKGRFMYSVRQIVLLLATMTVIVGCKSQQPMTKQAQQQSSYEEVPKAQDQPIAANSSSGTNVTISIRPEFLSDGRVRICGETNLPEGTELMISVEEKAVSGFTGQSKCSVVDGGRFHSEPFGRSDGLPKGVYIADVVMPITCIQPPAVQRVIGENGERLTGPLVARNALGVSVRSSTQFTVRVNSPIAVHEQSVPSPPKSASDDSATDVTYSIISSDILPGIKRSLDVRLSGKVSESALREIAMTLKAHDPRRYERTFICYYLPDMVVGTGAWATTHFNPGLEVRIQGLTVEQEKMLKQQVDSPSQEVIGSWLDEGVLARRVTIFKQGGKLFMETMWKDGSGGKTEIVEKSSRVGRIFQEATGGGNAGEYYLIDSQGNLQTWDREGIVCTARRLR